MVFIKIMFGISKIKSSKGFTIVEILLVLVLASMVAVSFSNMFIFGVKGSNDNADHVIAYNLAREKIEEIKGLPFELVQSDYEIFRDVFQDRFSYDEAYYNEESFENYFSDVFSEADIELDSEKKLTHKKLAELYPKYYLKELPFYPPEYGKLRRVMKMELISEPPAPAKLKKVTVMVFDQRNICIAKLVTLIGLHK